MPDLYGRILEQTERLGITGKELGELLGLKKSPLTDWKITSLILRWSSLLKCAKFSQSLLTTYYSESLTFYHRIIKNLLTLMTS